MSESIPFQLHVESMLGIPDIGDGYIQYAAPNIVKLEIGTYTTVNTGIRISRCQTHGEIHVSLAEPYDSMIEINKNVFDPYYKPQLTVQLYNKSDQYVRIAPEDVKLFKYKWISTSESVEPESEQSTSESVEPESEQSTFESVEPESEQSTSESVEPESEQSTFESVEPESEQSTSESVRASTVFDSKVKLVKRRAYKKRILHK